jgi:hypothetical protein
LIKLERYRAVLSIPAFQHSSIPAFQHSSIPAFQHSSIPAFQHSIPFFIGAQKNPALSRRVFQFIEVLG